MKPLRGKTENGASATGIIGDPDEETIRALRELTGEHVRKIERKGKIRIIIGKGFRRTVLRVPVKK